MPEFKVIAKISTDFPGKFGLPRQSGIVPALTGKIIFEPPYRDFSAVRELSEFSHLWIVWLFSGFETEKWSPTVRPPRLGGNRRVGVFATRSPNRPNPIGLSAVKLERVENDKNSGPVLTVSGIDMTDGTEILDIKPYLSFADAYPQAVCGFADTHKSDSLAVSMSEEIRRSLPQDYIDALCDVLAGDPRPHYQDDPARVYGFIFAGYEVKFRVTDGILTVLSVAPQ